MLIEQANPVSLEWNPQLNQLTITSLQKEVLHTTILAQTVREVDVLGQMQKSFNHFVQSGQIWALIIGIFLGYMFKSVTSF
jgi:hypothetical protein